MPNWCFNSIISTANTKTELVKFMRSVASGRGSKRMPFDFDKIVPRDLQNKEYWTKVYKDSSGHLYSADHVQVCDMVELAPADSTETDERGGKFAGYAFNWYEWQNRFWGTKWNACDIQMVEPTRNADGSWVVEYTFNTAWCCPSPVFKALCAKYPNLSFEGTYEIEGCDGSGSWSSIGDGNYVEC